MPITLSLSSVDLDDEALQELTRQLCRDLNNEAGLGVSPGAKPAETGDKSGEIAIIGQILIKAVGAGGAIAALVGVLKAYVQRKPSLQFEFQKKGGDKLKIKADDLRADDMTKLVQAIKKAVSAFRAIACSSRAPSEPTAPTACALSNRGSKTMRITSCPKSSSRRTV